MASAYDNPKLALLRHLARVARGAPYRMHVWQWLPGNVGAHSAGSLHNRVFVETNIGRAFDAYSNGRIGKSLTMAVYARHLRKHYRSQLTECIYNGRWTKVSIKSGQNVHPSYWGKATWDAHKSHVHVAI